MPQTDAQPVLVPTSELAKRLHCDVRTIHRMVERGELVPYIQGPGATGAYLFRADALAGAP